MRVSLGTAGRYNSAMSEASAANRQSDVVIIGGGVIGLCCALALAKEKVRVTLLEAGLIGRESSWSGAGVLAPCSWNRHDSMSVMLRDGMVMFGEFVSELEAATGADVEYRRCGKLELLYTDQHVRMARSEETAARERYASRYGSPLFEVLESDAARELEPNIADDALAVTRCHFTTQLRNPRLLAALRTACERTGVRLEEGRPASGLVREKERVVGVRSGAACYRAEHVVLAAGSWSGLSDSRVSALAPVYPVRGQIVLLREEPGLIRHVVERGKCYIVPRLDGRVLVGATEEHESGYDKSNTAEGVGWLLAEAVRLVPALKRARVERCWAGLRPGTPDRRPVIGTHDSCPGLIFATGHFRTGIALCLITARAVRDLVRRGRTEINLDKCQPGRSFEMRKKDRSGA